MLPVSQVTCQMQFQRHNQLFTNGLLLLPNGSFAPGSLLVEGDLITRIFPEGESLPDVVTVDLAGRTLVPGFVDAHIHLSELALKRQRCDLAGAESAGEVVERLKKAKTPGGREAVVGVDWDESAWKNKSFPTRVSLDEVDRDRPVYARRICGHVGVVNSAFMALLDPSSDYVDRDSGVITEFAVESANQLSRPPATAIVPAVEEAIAELHSLGITGIHDIVGPHSYDAYLDGIHSSSLPLRIDVMLITDPDEFGRLAKKNPDIGGGRFRPAGIKLFSDGSFGGWTAALNSPYADKQTIGEFLLDEDELERTLRRCCDEGISCAVHAIGDRAIRTVLLQMAKFPSNPDLFRIEHAELIGWDELRMLEKTRVFLCMQPNFVRNWQQPGGLYETRLGRDRWFRCNLFRSLHDAGVDFMFSSDGMPPGPLYGAGGATSHPLQAERLSLAETIHAYTAAPSSYGAFKRNTGRLENGFLADLVVLSGDTSSGDPDLLEVDITFVGGKPVYRREGPDGFE
jgi:predicted amidohydrolase YtcJ